MNPFFNLITLAASRLLTDVAKTGDFKDLKTRIFTLQEKLRESIEDKKAVVREARRCKLQLFDLENKYRNYRVESNKKLNEVSLLLAARDHYQDVPENPYIEDNEQTPVIISWGPHKVHIFPFNVNQEKPFVKDVVGFFISPQGKLITVERASDAGRFCISHLKQRKSYQVRGSV